jgi:hypothetical protein
MIDRKTYTNASQGMFYLCIRFLLLSLVSLFIYQARAQEEFVPAPAKLLTSFPFRQFTGGVVLIKAKFADYPDSLNFILDTGSGGISLDSTTCDRLQINLFLPIEQFVVSRG